MTHPHMLPTGMQAKTIRAGVMLGPTHGAARAPLHLAFGAARPADQVLALEADADAIESLFLRCPIKQWGAAAQAAMGMADRQYTTKGSAA